MSTESITDDQFEAEVLNSDTPVVVDFWAEWCGPCRALAPTLDEISDTMAGTVKVVKINIDENPNAPTKYGVRSIPTLMIFKGGQMVAQNVGALPKTELTKWVEEQV